jgi:transposase-like protein
MENSRFRDAGETIYEFVDNVLVECPRCKRCTKMTWVSNKLTPKFVCEKCGLVGGLMM